MSYYVEHIVMPTEHCRFDNGELTVKASSAAEAVNKYLQHFGYYGFTAVKWGTQYCAELTHTKSNMTLEEMLKHKEFIVKNDVTKKTYSFGVLKQG